MRGEKKYTLIMWQSNKIRRNDTTERYAPRFYECIMDEKKEILIELSAWNLHASSPESIFPSLVTMWQL